MKVFDRHYIQLMRLWYDIYITYIVDMWLKLPFDVVGLRVYLDRRCHSVYDVHSACLSRSLTPNIAASVTACTHRPVSVAVCGRWGGGMGPNF